ncbi:MAG: SIMPL domain-containing protein [Chitinophagaceae bacterium]
MKSIMKTFAAMFAILFVTQATIAQQGQPGYSLNPFPKTITVNGSAELEIIPDEIYVQIRLMEYQKKGDPKKDLEKIKADFLAACKAVGLSDSLISIASYAGNNNYYEVKKKKAPDMLAEITYQVRFSGSKQMDQLVEKLDDEATKSFRIVSTSHSRIADIKKQLKIKAIQAAREKGVYLTEAIGEKLGEAVTINEPAEWSQPLYANVSYAKMDNIGGENGGEAIDFKKLKFKFDVSVVFAIR